MYSGGNRDIRGGVHSLSPSLCFPAGKLDPRSSGRASDEITNLYRDRLILTNSRILSHKGKRKTAAHVSQNGAFGIVRERSGGTKRGLAISTASLQQNKRRKMEPRYTYIDVDVNARRK